MFGQQCQLNACHLCEDMCVGVAGVGGTEIEEHSIPPPELSFLLIYALSRFTPHFILQLSTYIIDYFLLGLFLVVLSL